MIAQMKPSAERTESRLPWLERGLLMEAGRTAAPNDSALLPYRLCAWVKKGGSNVADFCQQCSEGTGRYLRP